MHDLFNIPHLIYSYGYFGVLLIIFLESGIFFPLPGDSLIFTVGLLAPELHYDVWLFLLLSTLAAFLGGLAGYYIGQKLDYLYKYAFWRKVLPQKYIDEAKEFLNAHGLSAIMLSRFVPVVRTFLPIVAGMAGMQYKKFVKDSLLACFIWSAVFILGGYYLGKIFPQIGDYLSLLIITVVFVSLLPGIFHFLKKK